MPPYQHGEETGRYDLQLSNTQTTIVNAHQETPHNIEKKREIHEEAARVLLSLSQSTTHPHPQSGRNPSWPTTSMEPLAHGKDIESTIVSQSTYNSRYIQMIL